jgi:hypothetical protein
MVAPIVLLAVLTGAGASAQPSASPQPPLKEIIHVRSSPLCTDFARHANGAIDSATRNDVAVSTLIGSLRTGDLDRNEIAHRNALEHLHDLADAITKDWKNGEKEVGELRKLSDRANDPATKKELKSAADALGGALWRQRKIARDLDGFVAYLHARDMSAVDEDQANMNIALFGVGDAKDALREGTTPEGGKDEGHAIGQQRMYSNPGLANEQDLPPMADQADVAASDFERQLPDIIRDEITAAEHVATAAESC